MKRLCRIFDGLSREFKSHKVLFTLMVIGITLSASMLIYSYGNLSAYIYSFYPTEYRARQYSVANKIHYSYYIGDIEQEVPHHAEYTLDEIESLDIGKDISTYFVSWGLFTETEECVIWGSGAITGGRDHVAFGAYSDDVVRAKNYMGRTVFLEGDDPYSVILPCTNTTRALTYDEETDSYGILIYKDIHFKIIGVSTSPTVMILQYDTYKELFADIIPNSVSYLLKENVSIEESRDFSNHLTELYKANMSKASNPYGEYLLIQGIYAPRVKRIFYLYLASLIAFAFFIEYFTEKSKRSDAIARTCGAKRMSLVTDMLVRNLLLSLFGFAVAFLIHKFILGNAIDTFASVRYDSRDWLLMTATVVISTVIISIPSLVKMFTLNVCENRRRAE